MSYLTPQLIIFAICHEPRRAHGCPGTDLPRTYRKPHLRVQLKNTYQRPSTPHSIELSALHLRKFSSAVRRRPTAGLQRDIINIQRRCEAAGRIRSL